MKFEQNVAIGTSFELHVHYPGPEQNRSFGQLFCKQNCFPVINYRDVHRRFTVTEDSA